jgi:gluconolactonase
VLFAHIFAVAFSPGTASQEPTESLIEPNANVELLRDGFSFVEGPVSDAEGNVYFSDIPENRIYRWTTNGELELVREETGGANGLIFDAQGNLLACEGGAQRITSMNSAGEVSVVVERYDGKRLNSPNDIWIDARGGFYFTDPRYGAADSLPQDGEHVYYVRPDRKSITRVADDLRKPNGIIGSLDGAKLYVADTTGETYVFDIRDDASLGPKRLFAPQGSDGMTMDERGNLYLTWQDGVSIYAPDGKRLDVIELPETPANVGFGGADGRTLFITARTGLYAIRMAVAGRPQPNRP